MENRAHALAAGLFILGLLVAAAFVGNWLAGAPLVRVPYRVVALQPVTGLNPQGQVRYRGISVGRVSTIDLDLKDPKRIFIDIEVEERIPITRGTYAQLGQEGITGIAYVHLLDEGNDPAPIAGGPSGKPEIPLRASMLDDLFDSAGGIGKDARVLVASVQKLLNADNQENFAATLATVKQVSINLEAATRRLPGTIDRADRMLSEQNRRQLSESLASANAAMKEIPELAREARAMVGEARKLAESVNRLSEEALGTTGAIRNETLPRTHALAEAVEQGANRIGRLAYELERRPQSVLWGRPGVRPGPGEAGFE
ncbi:MAG: MCE family protein [Betaproteobacteria bacterium]|nr:MCE family protein [Betaproteobacteria bacterium]